MTAAMSLSREKTNIDFYKLAHNNGHQRLGYLWMSRKIKKTKLLQYKEKERNTEALS